MGKGLGLELNVAMLVQSKYEMSFGSFCCAEV